MNRKNILVLASLLLIVCSNTFAQHNFFTDKAEANFLDASAKRVTIPNKYRTVELNVAAIKTFLATLPNETVAFANRNNTPIVELPMPDGSAAQFHVWESSVMEQGLANDFPNIKTYTGQGITDKAAVIRFDMTELGFHAMILSSISGSIFIDPYDQSTTTNYITYYKKDFYKKESFKELHSKSFGASLQSGSASKLIPAGQCIGSQRRNYRLAVACTHQYAQAATGLANPTKSETMSAITTSVNRVTGVYELEVGIHFNLVANNQNIVYTNAANDTALGQFDSDPFGLLDKSQSHITLIIGSANFDIGHTFSTGGGGVAGLGVVCDDAQKASGITGQPNPVGDAYDIDYVAHEMGHQFNADHPFNANTNYCRDNTNSYSASTATNCEPGSGSTIMAYAGICDSVGITNDLQPHSDPQFHAINIAQILDYSINDIGNNCPTITNTGNHAPTASAGADYTIPINTPFILTGTGADIDNDVLTYSWEEMDVFGAIGDWNAPQTINIPLFRSFVPKTTGVRYFPKLSDVVNATTTIGERLPSISRTMKFRLTVRDNKAGGGGTCFDDAVLTVNNTGGAFSVTSQNTNGIVWMDGETKTITWNKASTAIAPFNVANVAIELSTDGGYTFPVTLLASTPNDGSENIVVPVNYTTTARVRVRALGNIFYAMNTINFTIKVNTTPVKWLSVIAEKEKNKTVKVLWTVNEIDNHFYEVERSNTSDKFDRIGTVTAFANNGTNHNYSFLDIKPLIGKNYYRIKQVDKDGHYSYSTIVFVMVDESNNSYTVYPNPTTNNNINLYCNNSSTNLKIEIFDAIGKMVFAQTKEQTTRGEIININLGNIAKGVYSIRLQASNAEVVCKKIIVQ